MKPIAVLAAVAAILVSLPAAAGPSGLTVVARVPGPDGHWDYASFDPARRRVYLSHGDAIMTLNPDSLALNPSFAPGDHLHAIIAVPGTDVLVSTNSGDSTARILDAASGRLLASIPTAKDTDGAVYDPSSGLVIVIDGDSGELTLVDPKARRGVGSIAIGGSLEAGDVDGHGRFYDNIASAGQVAVVDIAQRKVLARYAMTGCEHPTALAYVAGDRLVVACGAGAAKILDAHSGRELASFAIGAFPDSVLYDPVRSLALIPSARTGTLAVIALSGPKANTVIDTVTTEIGARTGAVDARTGRVFLPTAEYVLPVPAGQRPQTKPGTFHVLVLDRR